METSCKNQSMGALNRAGVTKWPLKLSRHEWASVLRPFQFAVLRECQTERAGSGEYLKTKDPGTYHCSACGVLLFDSKWKLQSPCGWPSFAKPASDPKNHEGSSNVGTRKDCSFGLVRTEVYCRKCNSHLGHVFDHAPRPNRQRYCVNSTAMQFVPINRD